jgi:hypothetical protein
MKHKLEFDAKAKRPPQGVEQPAACDTNKQEAKIVHHYGPNAVMRSAP